MIPKLNIGGYKFEFILVWHQKIVSWYKDQIDLLPPYGNYQGILLGKLIKDDRCYIDLGIDRVEVDKVTFSILEDGDLFLSMNHIYHQDHMSDQWCKKNLTPLLLPYEASNQLELQIQPYLQLD